MNLFIYNLQYLYFLRQKQVSSLTMYHAMMEHFAKVSLFLCLDSGLMFKGLSRAYIPDLSIEPQQPSGPQPKDGELDSESTVL